jgi:hypothetical protein
MFINEQTAEFSELQPSFRNEFLDKLIWSQVSCRHCMWTYKPLVRCDERGNTVRGSRLRNPFPPFA